MNWFNFRQNILGLLAGFGLGILYSVYKITRVNCRLQWPSFLRCTMQILHIAILTLYGSNVEIKTSTDALYSGLGAAATTVLQIKMILTVGSLLLIPLEPSQKQSVTIIKLTRKQPAVSFCLTVENTVS